VLDEELTAVTIQLIEDDHGHATLVVHGEPEVVTELAKVVTLILAADADHVSILEPDGTETPLEEDLASSS
jgi:hypothetical protein